MFTFSHSPELLKGSFVALDVATGTVKQMIALQYNSDSPTRRYQVHGALSRTSQQAGCRARITSATLSVVVKLCR